MIFDGCDSECLSRGQCFFLDLLDGGLPAFGSHKTSAMFENSDGAPGSFENRASSSLRLSASCSVKDLLEPKSLVHARRIVSYEPSSK